MDEDEGGKGNMQHKYLGHPTMKSFWLLLIKTLVLNLTAIWYTVRLPKLIWVRHWESDDSQAISHNLANAHYCDTLFMLPDSNTKAGFGTKASSFPVFTVPLLLVNEACAILLDHEFHLLCRVNEGFDVNYFSFLLSVPHNPFFKKY
jgi:hypothetical protein